MATNQTYTDFYSYFKQIAEQNHNIAHVSNSTKEKRFFSSDLHSFIADQTSFMDRYDLMNCVLHFIDPQWSIDPTISQEIAVYQCMFFVFKGVKKDGPSANEEEERIAKHVAEETVKQILAKMKHDSRNKNQLLNRSLDTLKGVRVTPQRYSSQAIWLGYQVSFTINANWDVCFDVTDWQL